MYTLIVKKTILQRYRSSKALLAVALNNNQIVIFTDDFTYYHYSIQSQKLLCQGRVPGKVFQGVALSQHILIVTIVQTLSVYKINLKTLQTVQIYKIIPSILSLQSKQKQKFYITRIKVFRETEDFYLQQDIVEERKVKIIHFKNDNIIQPTIKQFMLKEFLIMKLDETSKIVMFAQNPHQNGSYKFQQIDLITNQQKKLTIDHASFILYSTVTQIRKIDNQRYLICLNSKQAKHQIIIMDKNQIITLFKNQYIIGECLILNPLLNYGVFSFMYGSQQIIMVNLKNGQIMDKIDFSYQKISPSPNQNYLMQQCRSIKPTQTMVLTIHFAQKQVNFMKLLQNIGVQQLYGSQLCQNILYLLS